MSRKDAYSTIKGELQETLALVAEKSGWEAGTVMELIRAVRLTEKLEAPAQKPPAPPPAQGKSPGEGNIAYTKYLLKNYRLLKSAVDARITSTVQMLDNAQMQMLMEREESVKNQQVRSIAMISAKDRVLFAQLESALEQMRLICEASKNPREQRQYKILVSRYIHGLSLNRTLDLYGIEKSEYFRCHTNAVEKLSVIMFGAERGNISTGTSTALRISIRRTACRTWKYSTSNQQSRAETALKRSLWIIFFRLRCKLVFGKLF